MTIRSIHGLPPRIFVVAVLLLSVGGIGVCQVKVASRTAREWFGNSSLAALAEAASRGDSQEIDRLLQSGVPVDGLGSADITPLAFALMTPNPKGVEALLKHGANPNHCIKESSNAEGKQPIILFLTRTKRTDLLELLLRYGADPNTRRPVRKKSFPYRGASLLIESVMSLEHVKTLVKYGANVNCVPQSSYMEGGDSAIEVAAGLGQFQVVEFLLNHGATRLDETVHSLQIRAWAPDARKERLVLLAKLRNLGAKIYAKYQPSRSQTIEMYPNTDVPSAWLTPGAYQCKEYKDDVPVDQARLK